ncbi:hypothetical protein PV325_005766 [Microctonus aethiopoides]|nr:hypothetical protein PV325_005766 [Microctonus aethiopoides]
MSVYLLSRLILISSRASYWVDYPGFLCTVCSSPLFQAELDLRCTAADINNTLRRYGSSSPVWRKKSNNGVFGTSIEEISDTDSQFSFSNEESSSLHDINELEADNTDKESDFNLKVIASRGDNIIAVANPALMECNHPIKKEPEDEKSIL